MERDSALVNSMGSMEVEKKRKRGTSGEGEDDGEKKRKKERGGKGEKDAAAPTEEEVEEFFAILRRMQVAVKYFKSNGAGDGRELTDTLGTAVETGVLRGGEDLKVEKKIVDGVKKTAALDLNVIPDVDGSSV